MATLSVAVALSVKVPLSVDPAVGAVTDTVGAVRSFDTVTVTMAEVVVLVRVSRALADNVCVPLATVVVFQL